MEAAGYRYDAEGSKDGKIAWAPDGMHELYGFIHFESWADVVDWLDSVIKEGHLDSERVDRMRRKCSEVMDPALLFITLMKIRLEKNTYFEVWTM